MDKVRENIQKLRLEPSLKNLLRSQGKDCQDCPINLFCPLYMLTEFKIVFLITEIEKIANLTIQLRCPVLVYKS